MPFADSAKTEGSIQKKTAQDGFFFTTSARGVSFNSPVRCAGTQRHKHTMMIIHVRLRSVGFA